MTRETPSISMNYLSKPVRHVYRVYVQQIFVLTFSADRYIGVDRCFTSLKAALTLFRNLIKHSDFSNSKPIFKSASCGDLSVGYYDADYYCITSFHLTSKKL